jgi:hypothetical protein
VNHRNADNVQLTGTFLVCGQKQIKKVKIKNNCRNFRGADLK